MLRIASAEGNVRVHLPTKNMLRHAVVLGSSGSGKTVASKVIVEEMLIQGKPCIAVDPQGDLASMALGSDVMRNFGVEFVVWTPASSAGVPISLNPLDLQSLPQDVMERVQVLASMASSFASFLGYEKGEASESVVGFLEVLFDYMHQNNVAFEGFEKLSTYITALPKALSEKTERVITSKTRLALSRKIALLSIGSKQLLFEFGMPMNIEMLLGVGEYKSKLTRCSIIYLNTLHTQAEKELLINTLVSKLYAWMLRNPSPDPQALFYIDEVSSYIPPVRVPACKRNLMLLFKQARKYGICCLVASQNPADIDYKALAQFSTWFIGRTMVAQDLKKIKALFDGMGRPDADELLDQVPSLHVGHFFLVSADHPRSGEMIRFRWLITPHRTLEESEIPPHVVYQDQDPVDQDPVDQDPVDQDPVDQDPMQPDDLDLCTINDDIVHDFEPCFTSSKHYEWMAEDYGAIKRFYKHHRPIKYLFFGLMCEESALGSVDTQSPELLGFRTSYRSDADLERMIRSFGLELSELCSQYRTIYSHVEKQDYCTASQKKALDALTEKIKITLWKHNVVTLEKGAREALLVIFP